WQRALRKAYTRRNPIALAWASRQEFLRDTNLLGDIPRSAIGFFEQRRGVGRATPVLHDAAKRLHRGVASEVRDIVAEVRLAGLDSVEMAFVVSDDGVNQPHGPQRSPSNGRSLRSPCWLARFPFEGAAAG